LFRGAKTRVHSPNLTGWQSIERRAQRLREEIVQNFPDSPVHVIAHSMGGLDARYAISRLGMGERIASLTTIGTPHQGTPVADLALGIIPSSAQRLAERILNQMGWTTEGIRQVSRDHHRQSLSELLPMDPRVAYYSVSSVIPRREQRKRSLPVFWFTEPLLRSIEGENDGLIPETSAKYGLYLGSFDGDHYGQIGQLLGRSRGLKYLDLYAAISRRLRSDF